MDGGFTRRLADRIRRLSPSAFRAIDELCAVLETIEPVSPVIIALRIACETRKAFTRSRKRA